MKKSILFMLAAVLLLPSSLMAGLQQERLLENVLFRFQEIITERGGDSGSISMENIALDRSIPFEVTVSGQDFTMYAVKIVLTGPEPGRKQNVTLIVDETGNIQLDGAFADLRTGRSIHQGIMDELERMDTDPGVGDLLFHGSGQAEVLYLSDPFCPYCRHAYTYFLDQKNRIGEFRIAHYPINPGSGSLALTFLMMEHKDADIFRKVVDFAYEVELDRPSDNADHAVIEVFNERFDIYPQPAQEVFDYLQRKHQESLVRDMEKMRDMGLSGTPVIIINGIRVDGYNRQRIDDLLNRPIG